MAQLSEQSANPARGRTDQGGTISTPVQRRHTTAHYANGESKWSGGGNPANGAHEWTKALHFEIRRKGTHFCDVGSAFTGTGIKLNSSNRTPRFASKESALQRQPMQPIICDQTQTQRRYPTINAKSIQNQGVRESPRSVFQCVRSMVPTTFASIVKHRQPITRVLPPDLPTQFWPIPNAHPMIDRCLLRYRYRRL